MQWVWGGIWRMATIHLHFIRINPPRMPQNGWKYWNADFPLIYFPLHRIFRALIKVKVCFIGGFVIMSGDGSKLDWLGLVPPPATVTFSVLVVGRGRCGPLHLGESVLSSSPTWQHLQEAGARPGTRYGWDWVPWGGGEGEQQFVLPTTLDSCKLRLLGGS